MARAAAVATRKARDTLVEKQQEVAILPESETTREVGIALVSLIVPVFNEQEAIPVFYQKIVEILMPLAPLTRFEILFVNDGSTDATELAIRQLPDIGPIVRLINLSRNFGKESALRAGFDFATGDAVIPIDVDLQDPPEIIPAMIVKWREGAKVVNARRSDRSQDSRIKRSSANAFYKVFNMLSDQPIPNNVGDFRLFDRQVVDVVRTFGERAQFNKSLFAWVGFSPVEVTFERKSRSTGETTWSYWRLWNLALDGIFSSSTMPLRVWSYVGGILSILSFSYAVFILFFTLVFGADTPGYASTVILILMFGGLNLLAIGIIGEYVGRIYAEVRKRPLYIVRSTHGVEMEP